MFNKRLFLSPLSSLILISIGSGLIIAIDQFIKYKIRLNGGFYICNSGISFGLTVLPVLFWLILGLFLLLSIAYFKYLIKNGLLSPLVVLSFILILGGALSNGLDRFYLGCVLDFFSIKLHPFTFFNFADMAIFIGSCLLFVLILFKRTT